MTPLSEPGISYNYLTNKTTIFIDTDLYYSETVIVLKLQIQYVAQAVLDFLDLTIRIAVKPNEKFVSLMNSGPPTFQTQINDIQIIIDQELNYIFPVVTDPDKDNYSMKIECGGAIKFTEISSSGLILKPKQDDIGKYQCKVTMSDDHKYQKSSTTIVNIIVGSSINEQLKTELSNNIIRNNTSTLLKAIIQKITKYGEVLVKFNREIKKPPNCHAIDLTTLLLIIEPAETSDIKMLDFSWKVTDCTHKLQYTCSDSIPNQLDKNTMPLFDIQFPANSKMFYNLLTSMSSFDILPTQKLDEEILDLKDETTDLGKF
eukprot:403357161